MIPIKKGDIFTVEGVGENPSGHLILRKKQSFGVPFWGRNMVTGKRGKATRLRVYRALNAAHAEYINGEYVMQNNLRVETIKPPIIP
jgi:hypothetical protein